MKNLLLIIIFLIGGIYGNFLYSREVAHLAHRVRVEGVSKKVGPQEDFKITQKDIYELVDKTFSLETPRVRLEAQKIVSCESNWHFSSKNGSSTASGAFQFIDSTWVRYRRMMGRNPDLLLRYNPVENIETAYYLWKLDGWKQWECKKVI